MLPHDGVGACTPKPKKDKPASATITAAQAKLASAFVGDTDRVGLERAPVGPQRMLQVPRQRHLLDHLDALGQREQRPLGVVGGDADDHVIHDPRGALNDVEMPVGDRVERAGVKAGAQRPGNRFHVMRSVVRG